MHRVKLSVAALMVAATALAFFGARPAAADEAARADSAGLYRLREIEVSGTRASERKSPVGFTELGRKAIREKYWAQDVPILLAETPGVYSYSDAGNGIGYSYVKIRGFPQPRVSVTINGIPLNDPESHEVYWVDHPDLVSSAQSLQVQRGVGSALYGASAVGGSANLETLGIPDDRRISLQAGTGGY